MSGTDACGVDGLRHDVSTKLEILDRRIGKIEGIVEKVTDHHKTLYGNGHEGMKVTIAKQTIQLKALLWMAGVIITLLVANILIKIV